MEWNFLSGVGAVFLGYYSLTFVLQFLHGIRAFVLPTLGIKKNLKKLGQWAGKAASMRFTCAKIVLFLKSVSSFFPSKFQVILVILNVHLSSQMPEALKLCVLFLCVHILQACRGADLIAQFNKQCIRILFNCVPRDQLQLIRRRLLFSLHY